MNHTLKLRNLLVIGCTLFIFSKALSQRFPMEGDTLNYTNILMRFPWINGASSYQIEISELENTDNTSLVTLSNNTFIAKNMEFGKSYSWRYCGVDANGQVLTWSEPSNFVIGTSFGVDSSKTHFNVQSRDRARTASGLLFYDYAKTAINRNGNPIWFIPAIEGIKNDAQVRDLKMTHNGTFTALFDMTAIEFDRDGEILWTAPDDGKVSGAERENYHHEFTKLKNGNYLVLGNGKAFRHIPNSADSSEIEFGVVIEYNAEGDPVWTWNSKNYFTNEELFLRTRGDFYETQTHLNSCIMNDSLVIVGFRDISRIVVIDKKSGKVKESYGGFGVISEPHSATGFFRRQHSGNLLRDGSIAVLNNDSVMDPQVVSSAVIFSRISEENPVSEKIFDFKFDFDSLTNGKSLRTGNLLEMENGNLLINMGALNRCIEVTRNSEVVSDIFIEKFDTLMNKWQPFPQYRVSYAPSLYPFEFTSKLEVNEPLRGKKKRKLIIRIYNVGNETDSYTISGIFDKKGAIPTREVTIDSGQFADVELIMKTRKKCEVMVRSKHNLIHKEELMIEKCKSKE